MVVKTDLCAFSEMKVYPGKGRRFVTKSGQLVVLAGSKVRGLREGGKKPAKLVWTQAWRRMHKKLNVETSSRRRVKKIVKASVSRAYVGMAAVAKSDKVAPTKAAKPTAAAAAGEKVKVSQEYLKEQKEKAKKAAAERKKLQGSKAPTTTGAKHAGKGR